MTAGRVLDGLLVRLRSEDPEAVKRAIADLRGLRAPETFERLRHLAFESAEIEAGRAALMALACMGDGRGEEVCMIALRRAGPGRATYAAILGHGLSLKTEEALIAALGDADPEVRLQAAASLSLRGRTSWAARVKGDDGDLKRLSTSASPSLTLALIRALEQASVEAARLLNVKGDERAREGLEAALASPDAALREAAATALGPCGDKRSRAPLKALLGDPVGPVRAAAAGALAHHRRGHWALLIQGDEEDWRRLGESGKPRARHVLLRAAKRGEVSAIAALGALDLEEARGDLRALLRRSAHPVIQAAAAAAMAGWGEVDGVVVLEAAGCVEALSYLTVEEPLAEEAVQALSRIGGPVAAETGRVLLYGEARDRTRALIDEREALFFSPQRRRQIADALRPLRRQRRRGAALLAALGDTDGLLEALVDRDNVLRAVICDALAELGEQSWLPVIRANNGDLRRLAGCDAPERLRLLVVARDQGADLPAEARALLAEAQAGAFSLEAEGASGAISEVTPGSTGTISLDPSE